MLSGLRARLRAVAFEFVETQYEGQDHRHRDGDWYEISSGGVLAVHYADATKAAEYYPPHAWSRLIADQPPGRPLNHPGFHAPSGFCEPAGRPVTSWE